jgi:argininosuccinate lyase
MLAESLSLDVSELTLEQFKSVSNVFESEFLEILTVRHSIENRTSPGAASPQGVKEQIARLRNLA